jgi:hypothetical protein
MSAPAERPLLVPTKQGFSADEKSITQIHADIFGRFALAIRHPGASRPITPICVHLRDRLLICAEKPFPRPRRPRNWTTRRHQIGAVIQTIFQR